MHYSMSVSHVLSVLQSVVDSYLQILCHRSSQISDIVAWFGSQGSSVGIMTRLRVGQCAVQFAVGTRNFPLLKTSSCVGPTQRVHREYLHLHKYISSIQYQSRTEYWGLFSLSKTAGS
jgi:hypothetical protein